MRTELFISGKNWKLSLAELVSYLKARELVFSIAFFSKEFFAVDLEKDLIGSAIADLGGIIKIGEVKARFSTEIAQEAFIEKNKEVQSQIKKLVSDSGIVDEMAKQPEKVFFGVSVYSADKTLRPLSWMIQRFVGSTIKGEFASQGKKSKFMGFSKDRKSAQLSHVEVLKKRFVETKGEILLCIGKDETWIATTTGVHDPFEFQKRDIYKPNQRKIFAMPPRLARIMVNLSSCTPGKVLFDPFCGVGTVLLEALLAHAKVVGMDVNSWCVKAATQNLDWIKREYNLGAADYRVVQGDVGKLTVKIGQETVDCIVTEPDLGPALRQVPTVPYALKIIQKLEPLYFGFVEEASKVLKEHGCLVLVTPYIRTRTGQPVTMPIDEKLEKTGLKRIHPFPKEAFADKTKEVDDLVRIRSLIDIDERHKIGREIHIFQK